MNSPEASELAEQVHKMWLFLDPAPMPNSQMHWNLGGQPDSNLTYPARVIARRYWDISEETARKVVRAWEIE